MRGFCACSALLTPPPTPTPTPTPTPPPLLPHTLSPSTPRSRERFRELVERVESGRFVLDWYLVEMYARVLTEKGFVPEPLDALLARLRFMWSRAMSSAGKTDHPENVELVVDRDILRATV
jgi:hypothetical protein